MVCDSCVSFCCLFHSVHKNIDFMEDEVQRFLAQMTLSVITLILFGKVLSLFIVSFFSMIII
jgi:hypothetical protein